MKYCIPRRQFITNCTASAIMGRSLLDRPLFGKETSQPANEDRQIGLLVGGLVGDALGGPIEFSEKSSQEQNLVGARDWEPGRKITADDLALLAANIPLHGYETLRPEPSPYGPWRESAIAGTLTDDSRHKIVLIRAIANANDQGRAVTAADVARALLDFKPVTTAKDRAAILALDEEGFREYRYAARWLLGERDLKVARPIERLWAGIANCSGQMMLPPLAVAFAGEPVAAYKHAYEIDFIDAPLARDISAAMIAGLAAALDPKLDDAGPRSRWRSLLTAMRHTDPFGYAQVPFAGRPLHAWIGKADEFVRRSEAIPKRLYELLESEGKPVYWWDAHFTLLVPICMLKFCDFNPLAAMHLIMDFGHDTDSYAQVLGCMAGAVHGRSIFPTEMVEAVTKTLDVDYREDVGDWIDVLRRQSIASVAES